MTAFDWRELVAALLTQDVTLVRRIVGRIRIVRDLRSPFPILRDGAIGMLCAIGLFVLWIAIFVGVPLVGAALVGVP